MSYTNKNILYLRVIKSVKKNVFKKNNLRLVKNLEVVKGRLNRPLTLSEKVRCLEARNVS